ncbi:MAG: LytR C-terminal domain-containing protein [Gaiellaceae bacterium]
MLPVEHALPNPSRPHPWRTIAVVAAGVATLELLGLVVAGTALLAKPVAKASRAAALHRVAAPAKPKAPTTPILARRAVRVTVLNGNGIAGAAAATASQVRAHGYKIGLVGNAHRAYGRSVVIYRGTFRREAVRLAHDLGLALVSPLDGLRARDLHGAQLAVVLGSA